MSIGAFFDRHHSVRIESKEGHPMQYVLFMNYQEAGDLGLTQEDMAPAMAAFDAYADALDEAGVFVATNVLQPVAASTTVRKRDGALQVQDGPFADTKERIGGFFVIDVPDLDAALAWAEKNPAAEWGAIEIRPAAVSYERGKGWYTPA
jgi:hypothetical protein